MSSRLPLAARASHDSHREREHPADAVAAAVPRLTEQPYGLQPSEHFLDALAEPLADAVARVARGPRVERGDVLLGHVRRHVEGAQTFDEVAIVVVFVGAERGPAAPGNLLRHRPRGLPFGPPRGAG